MARFHNTPNGLIPFTAEEEAHRTAEEAAWAVKQSQPVPAPTKEELMAQLAALSAQIQALE